MYQPSIAWVENEGLLEAALWNKTLVPGGARGRVVEVKAAVYGGLGGKAWFCARRAD